MSFSLSNISGSQIQKDSFINNLTVACDPGLLAPKTDPLTGLPNPLNLEKRDGKTAIGVDICDLDVSNLTVNGNLVVKGSAEVCDIVCPQDFSVTAGNNIIETAGGAVSLVASTGQISLDALGTANLFGTAGVKVQANNARSTTATGNQSGGSLNVFPQVAGAKGLHVVCNDTVPGEFGIAADLTGTVILRADGTDLNTGATGHLMSAPSGVDTITFSPNAVDVTFAATTNITAFGVLGNCSDTCGTVIVEPTNSSAATRLTVTFAKRFPTPFVNVQITAGNRFGASCTDVWTDSVSVGSEATGFTLNFVSGPATAGEECLFHYFVMDVVGVAQQHG
jgi:hypothetical protein